MGLFDETAKAIPGQDVGETSTSGLGSLAAKAIQKAVDDGVLNANTVNTPLSDLKSIIVRDPSMVEISPLADANLIFYRNNADGYRLNIADEVIDVVSGNSGATLKGFLPLNLPVDLV